MTTYAAPHDQRVAGRRLEAFMFALAAVGVWFNPTPIQAAVEGIVPGAGALVAAALGATAVGFSTIDIAIYIVDVHHDGVRLVRALVAALVVTVSLFWLADNLWPDLHLAWLIVFGIGFLLALAVILGDKAGSPD